MKKMTEQEIDTLLFRALKQEPPGHLPAGFATKVTERIKAQETLRMGVVYCLITAVIAVALAAIFVWALKFIRFTDYTATIQPVLHYKWPALLLLLTILAGKLIDLKLTGRKLAYKA